MNATIAIQLLLGLLDRASAIGALISKARADKRDISDAELDALMAADDAARAALEKTIAAAKD